MRRVRLSFTYAWHQKSCVKERLASRDKEYYEQESIDFPAVSGFGIEMYKIIGIPKKEEKLYRAFSRRAVTKLTTISSFRCKLYNGEQLPDMPPCSQEIFDFDLHSSDQTLYT